MKSFITPLADQAKTSQFLASKGEVLTSAAMESFLDAVLKEFLHAAHLLGRRANGNYSPDQHLQSLPEYRQPELETAGAGKTLVLARVGKATSCLDLFEAYVKDVEPRASTINRWRTVFTTLDEAAALSATSPAKRHSIGRTR